MRRELAIRTIDGKHFIVVRRGKVDEYVALLGKEKGLAITDYFNIEFAPDKMSFKVYEKKKEKGKKVLIGEVVICGTFKGIAYDKRFPHLKFYLAEIEKIEIRNAPAI